MQRILVVDDSPTMRSLIVSTLEDLDDLVKVDEAESGFEALRLLPRGVYDLIVTDINMPDINGLELVSFARRDPRHANARLLVVSTEGSDRDRQKALDLGADAYIVKPFEPSELGRIAAELLDAAPTGSRD